MMLPGMETTKLGMESLATTGIPVVQAGGIRTSPGHAIRIEPFSHRLLAQVTTSDEEAAEEKP
jgi:hypothetical protein